MKNLLRVVTVSAVMLASACQCTTPIVETADAAQRDAGAGGDAGSRDAGVDAGLSDAGSTDGGTSDDAGTLDGSVADAGADDAGRDDAGVDGGADAGPLHCPAHFADCDLNPANGCEVNLQSDVTHCGQCDRACPTGDTTSACTGGECQVVSCLNGASDCNMSGLDGCELSATAPCRSTSLCRAVTKTCSASCTPNAVVCASGARLDAGVACGFLDGGACDSAGACLCPAGTPANTPCGVDSVCSDAGVCTQNRFWATVGCASTPTGNEMCADAGFARATSAWGYTWSECTGPNASAGQRDACQRYSADRSRCLDWGNSMACNCLPLSGMRFGVALSEWGGSPGYRFVVSDFFTRGCSGYNPGFSVRVSCEY